MKQSEIWQSILTFTGPLAETTHVKVPPHWRAVSSSYIETDYCFPRGSRLRSNTSAGTDTYGNILHLASAVIDGQQVIGHCSCQADFSYPSLEGGRSKSEPYAIMDNLNYYKWKTVTVRGLKTCAHECGVNLAYCANCSKVALYSCRIKFHKWLPKDAESSRQLRQLPTESSDEKCNCLLIGQYIAGSKSPEFCYDGICNCSLSEDMQIELLCYKQLSEIWEEK